MKSRMTLAVVLVAILMAVAGLALLWPPTPAAAQDPGSNYNVQGGKATVIGGTLTVASGGAETIASGGSLTAASGSTVTLAGTNTVSAGGSFGIGGGTAMTRVQVADVTFTNKTGSATITGLSNTVANLAKTYVSWGWRTNTARDPGKVYFTIPTTGTLTLTSANNTSATATVVVVVR